MEMRKPLMDRDMNFAFELAQFHSIAANSFEKMDNRRMYHHHLKISAKLIEPFFKTIQDRLAKLRKDYPSLELNANDN